MSQRIACLHAHHSNIEHIEKALSHDQVELIHFVEPGIDRVKSDSSVTTDMLKRKINDTLTWIAGCHVDAILVTCTFFTSMMEEEDLPVQIPIVKIDLPLFHSICNNSGRQILVFTNPNTVAGTMDQLAAFARDRQKEIQVEAALLPDTFELIMQGKTLEYITAVTTGLTQLAAQHPGVTLLAAQLSMVPAADSLSIEHHLSSLPSYMELLLNLTRKV